MQIANITLGTVTEEDLGWDDEKDEIDCNEVKRATTAVTVASAPNEQEEEEDEEDEDAFMASAHSLSSQ